VRGSVVFCAFGDIASRSDPTHGLASSPIKIVHTRSGPCFPIARLLVPEGEAAKSWDILAELYSQFIALKLGQELENSRIGGAR